MLYFEKKKKKNPNYKMFKNLHLLCSAIKKIVHKQKTTQGTQKQSQKHITQIYPRENNTNKNSAKELFVLQVKQQTPKVTNLIDNFYFIIFTS